MKGTKDANPSGDMAAATQPGDTGDVSMTKNDGAMSSGILEFVCLVRVTQLDDVEAGECVVELLMVVVLVEVTPPIDAQLTTHFLRRRL